MNERDRMRSLMGIGDLERRHPPRPRLSLRKTPSSLFRKDLRASP